MPNFEAHELKPSEFQLDRRWDALSFQNNDNHGRMYVPISMGIHLLSRTLRTKSAFMWETTQVEKN